jgi:phage gpG-like protein
VQASEFPLWAGRVADAVAGRAAKAAADAMAVEFHTELTDVTLRKSSHPRGQVTGAAPGGPPALVTGSLRRSARIVPAVASGPRAVSAVTVSAVYARIQELGGTVRAKRAPFLRFAYPKGRWHSVRSVRIPKRPYMAPTRDALLASGRLRARAAQAVAAVAREAAGG